MTYLDPDKLPVPFQRAVADWLEANGCRHYVALEPVILRGNVASYVAISRKDRRSTNRIPIADGSFVPLGVKRIRIRRPLAEFWPGAST